MLDDTTSPLVQGSQAALAIRGENNPATISIPIVLEVTGTIFLGVIAILLLIAWRRSEDRYHNLVEYVIDVRK